MRTVQRSGLIFLNHTSFVTMHLSYIIAALLPKASWAVPATLESRQSEPECKYDYFKQKVDHFGKNDSTFQQKYSLSTEFYKPGGPIFYMQGAEGSPLGCIDTTAAISWAEEFGGAAVVLEHRYFGDSLPFNATNPREQLAEYQYLTLDNVLEDVTFFLDDLKTKLEGATDSKVITNGCSYPAWLMTIYQQTRAAKVHATIAQSTSVEGLITEDDHTFKYGVNNLANNIYRAQNYEAWEKISNGYQALHDAVHAADYDKLKSDFGLCEVPNEETALNIRIYPGFVHLLATQYNYNTTGLPVKDPLNTMINIALDEQDPIKLLNRTVWTWMGPTGTKCLNVTDPQQGAYAGSGTGLQFGSFNYLNCKSPFLPCLSFPSSSKRKETFANTVSPSKKALSAPASPAATTSIPPCSASTTTPTTTSSTAARSATTSQYPKAKTSVQSTTSHARIFRRANAYCGPEENSIQRTRWDQGTKASTAQYSTSTQTET